MFIPYFTDFQQRNYVWKTWNQRDHSKHLFKNGDKYKKNTQKLKKIRLQIKRWNIMLKTGIIFGSNGSLDWLIDVIIFFNLTNNRLESFNYKLKSVIPIFSNLPDFFNKLFIIIKCFRSEKNKNAINVV